MNPNIEAYNNIESNFSAYRQNEVGYIPPPKPSLNGGLYTGEPFKSDSLYKNFPVKPDAVYMNTENLKSARPSVPNVSFQFPDGFRPGNNLPDTQAFGLSRYGNEHSILCTHYQPQTNVSCNSSANCESVQCMKHMENKGFNKHYYV